MQKTFLIITAFICFIILSVAFTQEPPKFKNLKILPKDISHEALDSIMDNYSISLGVKCNFCHVHNEQLDTWDMASDGRSEKLIARKMMLMTNGINTKYFPSEDKSNHQAMQTITCYTCHKGEAIPLSAPEIKEDSLSKK